ncbi:spc97/spc98 family domain-containing protein [Rhizoctonia solani AG-1 IA]|uniref:Spc97/spc98 family domain-containing protein n=1 Tax=Thanatephorus cucumeris (strain AG1-IA) TaxID=983506 RepID=L8WKC7_THACA|nr:spc97/spc98 family domain-containing protein [Rhizoctonia solani AG-1 IA]
MKKYITTPSSSGNRPVSRMSTATSVRAVSRLSSRTTTTARLRSSHVQHTAALLRILVQQVTGVGPEDDPDEFQEYMAGALDTVLNTSGPTNDMASVTKRIAGHREKARIHLQNDLADAITTSFRRMNALVDVDPEDRSADDPIKVQDASAPGRSSRSQPYIDIQLLLDHKIELSQPPTNTTHDYAYDLLREVHAPPPEPKDFWKQVLEEEPLEGEHWKTPWDDEDWDTKTLSSHPSMELESRESLSSPEPAAEDRASLIESNEGDEDEGRPNPFSYADFTQQRTLNDAHNLYEALCADQYWRPRYVNEAARRAEKEFNVNDPATLDPTVFKAPHLNVHSKRRLVRCSLLSERRRSRRIDINARSKFPNIYLSLRWNSVSEGGGMEYICFQPAWHGRIPTHFMQHSSNLPRVSHLTITAYRSLLSTFATTATILHHLRIFVSSVLRKSMNAPRAFSLHQPDLSLANVSTSLVLTSGHGPSGNQSCRALDAFAEAVGTRINALDAHCAGLEEQICNARLGSGLRDNSEPVVVSLLSLRRRLDKFMTRTFDILYDLIRALPDELPTQTYAHPRAYYSTVANSTITILSPLPIFAIQNIHPALLNKRLLDRLLVAVRACNRDGGQCGDTKSASDQTLYPMDGGSSQLMDVFISTAEPIWASVGAWVKWGIDVGGSALDIGLGSVEQAIRADDLSHDKEFFIKRRETVDVASPDFWTTGYVLRTTTAEDESDDEGALDAQMSHILARKAQGVFYPGMGGSVQKQARTLVPSCLIPVAARILASGKAVGLLRGIGVWGAIDGDYDSEDEDHDHGQDRDEDNDDDWPSFADTLKSSGGVTLRDVSFETGSLEDLGRYNLDDTILPESSFSIRSSSPTDTISVSDKYPLAFNLAAEVLLNDLPHILADRVAPRCQIAAFRLNRVLIEDCELWRHLYAMEDLCFMRRGDIMTHFCDNLFAKIDAQKPWSDYHLLNSLFRDVISATSTSWIDLGRVRLVYRGTKTRSSARSIRAVHGLEVEYEFPFPLPYVFGTSALHLYSQVFVLVLQLRRAKMVLDHILVRDHGTSRPELKVIYVLRGQLTWFVNTYMNYILTNVIHSQVLRFHRELADANSLDEMIVKHKDHIETVQEQCFLHSKDAAIHKTVLSILDMCVHFGDLFTSVVADNTLDISRPIMVKGRHSKRDRSRRQNLVSFVPPSEPDNVSTTSTELDETEYDSEDESVREGITERTTILDPTFLGPEDEEPGARVERLSKTLDTLIRTLRKRVELITGEGGPSAGAFGMLDFALEDWDL